MRSLLLFLAICLIAPLGISQENSASQKPQSLNEEEKRLILLQLYELGYARDTISSYENWIERERELSERERSVYQQSLENEKQKTEIMKKDRDLEADKAKFFEGLYNTVSKNRGCGFFGALGRVFTLGAYRCK